jgi:Na(+)-translocating NADH:ubiquinone oxidoreductase C subunit
MRKIGLFTVFFMILITVVFISTLAYIHEVSKNRIAENQQIRRVRSVLYACAILPHGIDEKDLPSTSQTDDIPWDDEALLPMMQNRTRMVGLPITPEQRRLLKNSFLSMQDSVDIVVLFDTTGRIQGYGFDLKGKGLWGTISAFAVISADLERMVGIDFTEQVETPGLGARITESGFKYYFRGLTLKGFVDSRTDRPPVIMMARKERSNLEDPTNSVQAITGATQTCNGVLNMINTDVAFYIDVLRQNKSYLETFNG